MGKNKHKRILIFGYSGSGKNWFGERLSLKSGVKFYDTDDLAWVKRFTVQRDYNEKCKMLKKICKRDRWIIVTGATSYVDCAIERADLIIILDIGFVRSTYRIVRRNRKKKKEGEVSLHSPFKLAHINFLDHWRRRKGHSFFKKLILKYPKKVKVMTQKEKRKFLKEFGD